MKSFKEWIKVKSNLINESEIFNHSNLNGELDKKRLMSLEKTLNSHAVEIDDTIWQNLYNTFIEYMGKENQHQQARIIGNALNSAATSGDMSDLNSLQENLKIGKFKIQVSSVNGWSDLKASTDDESHLPELYDSEQEALDEIEDMKKNIPEFEGRVVPEDTEQDEDLY